MTERQLQTWLTEQLKLAEPLDRPSDLADPQGVATTAAKKIALLGHGGGQLLTRAYQVENSKQCAAVLAECLALLPNNGPGELLSPADVAAMMGVSEDKVNGWCSDGFLKAANVNNGSRPRWVITRDKLNEFLASREPEPQQTQNRRSNGSRNGSKRY
jgi:hypothetical protein